jgi:phosphonate transport system substrate-binding protein
LSGYYSLLNKLAESGVDESIFDNIFCSGSHLGSIEAVFSGEADAAAIDSTVLRIRLREVPAIHKKLRVIEPWGPYPIQPLVVRSALHPELKQRLSAAFLATEQDHRTNRILKQFGLSRFVTVGQEDYTLDPTKTSRYYSLPGNLIAFFRSVGPSRSYTPSAAAPPLFVQKHPEP